jgi:hypothetical protein
LRDELTVAKSRIVALERTNKALTKADQTARREALLTVAAGGEPVKAKE